MNAIFFEESGVPLPQPLSWANSAKESLEFLYRGTKGAISKQMASEFATDFQNKHFRATFFRVIGHKYVMEIQRILTADMRTRLFTQAQWRTSLGVDRITVWRWKHEINYAEGEKFFVAQLLLANRPIGSLNLPDNAEMLMQSAVSMCKHLKSRYDSVNRLDPITPEVFRIVHELMGVMVRCEEAVYNPHDTTLNTKSKKEALKQLADHLCKKPSLTKQTIVLPSQVKMWLDGWGIAYSLFALGNRLSWTQLRVADHG